MRTLLIALVAASTVAGAASAQTVPVVPAVEATNFVFLAPFLAPLATLTLALSDSNNGTAGGTAN